MEGLQDILLDMLVCLRFVQEAMVFIMHPYMEYGIYGLERNIMATETQAVY